MQPKRSLVVETLLGLLEVAVAEKPPDHLDHGVDAWLPNDQTVRAPEVRLKSASQSTEDRFPLLGRPLDMEWSQGGCARQSGTVSELWAHTLTWADVDPARHPFEMDAAASEELASLVATLLPSADVAREDRCRSLDAVTDFLAGRYGRWACGWNWSVGEGDIDGGVVEVWCCSSDSVTTPDATAPLVVEALQEWRGWLEDLTERFAALAPPDNTPVSSADLWHWERACTRLVTVVADRTQADSGWYGHCMQVLRWFLAYNGIDEGQAGEVVKNAVGGQFGSWIAPDVPVVDAVSSRFARDVGEIR
ncbi:hypothetical protein ACI2LV_13225 [Streptomyces fungicidicus]|uniref:hypothetical protein n=1 Tax=Streptomyces fungicidicus TaxID=68203 RepID=UPI00384A8D76